MTRPPTAATSWFEEFRRLYDTVPCVEVQTLREHTDQVLHLSFSHSGYQFASCSKDCTVKVRAAPRGVFIFFRFFPHIGHYRILSIVPVLYYCILLYVPC